MLIPFCAQQIRPSADWPNTTSNIYDISSYSIRVIEAMKALLDNFTRFYPLPGKTCYPLVLEGNKVKMLHTISPGNYWEME